MTWIQEPSLRTTPDGDVIVSDFEHDARFRINPNLPPEDLVAEIVAIANRAYTLGRGAGRRDLQDDFRRLMGCGRF
jgi:hypothetical protein